MSRSVPWIIAVSAACWVVWEARRPEPEPGGMNLEEFGALPIAYQGREKPIDTLARNVLMAISRRQTFVEGERRHSATRWFLDSVAAKGAEKYKVFRVDHPQVLDLLGLKAREGHRYSAVEIGAKVKVFTEEAMRAHKRKAAKLPLDTYESKVLELADDMGFFQNLTELRMPHWVPPSEPGREWMTLAEAVGEERESGRVDPNLAYLRRILQAYMDDQAAEFNIAVAGYRTQLEMSRPKEMARHRFETFFNHVEPFYKCSLLYGGAFLLTALSWLFGSKTLGRSAVGLISLSAVIHTAALAARIYLSGRPPVTNLYGTAIFIGWGCVVLGLALEAVFRMGVGSALASVTGGLTLVVAHFLSLDGDTMEVLQAVLDTQFWLATHVVCITLGYAATLAAGTLATMFILGGVFTRDLTESARRNLSRMTYGVICFATFFSFVGTVLGGLWADDSWGRFWGWDPKENGALMIVLWNAVFLHSRWGGLARERGLAILAVFGNIVTTWSWFGVNNLGVGLHSYGFTEGRELWLLAYMVTQLVVMAVGLIPERLWASAPRSAGARSATPAA